MWKDDEILMAELTAAAVEGAMMPQHQWYLRFNYTGKSVTNLRHNSCPKFEETGVHKENTPNSTQMITEMAKCIAKLTTTVHISGYNQFSYCAPIVGTSASAIYGHLKFLHTFTLEIAGILAKQCVKDAIWSRGVCVYNRNAKVFHLPKALMAESSRPACAAAWFDFPVNKLLEFVP